MDFEIELDRASSRFPNDAFISIHLEFEVNMGKNVDNNRAAPLREAVQRIGLKQLSLHTTGLEQRKSTYISTEKCHFGMLTILLKVKQHFSSRIVFIVERFLGN